MCLPMIPESLNMLRDDLPPAPGSCFDEIRLNSARALFTGPFLPRKVDSSPLVVNGRFVDDENRHPPS